MERICTYDPKTAKKIKEIDIAILLIIVGVSIWALVQYNYFNEKVSENIEQYGIIGVFVATVLMEIIPQALHPFVCVIMAIGVDINLMYATIIAIIGSLFGSVIGFEIGKKYGFKFVCPLFKEKTMRETLRLWDRYGKEFVFVSALTPLPYMPLIFGALGLKRKQFVFWGIIPRLLGYATLGWLLYWGFQIF